MYYSHRRFNLQVFIAWVSKWIKIELDACDWDVLYRAENIDKKVEILNSYLMSSFDKHALTRSISPKQLPYFTLAYGGY